MECSLPTGIQTKIRERKLRSAVNRQGAFQQRGVKQTDVKNRCMYLTDSVLFKFDWPITEIIQIYPEVVTLIIITRYANLTNLLSLQSLLHYL